VTEWKIELALGNWNRPWGYLLRNGKLWGQSDLPTLQFWMEQFKKDEAMQLTTTRLAPKPFAWSYSKLKNFEACPKKHYHVDILKDCREDESEQLTYGNELHKAIAERIDKKKPLPLPYTFMEDWAKKVENGPGILLVEQKLAITKDFKKTGYFDRDVWFRGVADVLRVAGKVALVLDWKTGKIVEDSVQLALTAQCIFSHYPEVMKVRSEFIWLKEEATTRGDFSRDDMTGLWAGLYPRVESMVVAANTTTYPAKPGGLCRRYCPVTKCPHHGVG